jgi:hypothetical protein
MFSLQRNMSALAITTVPAYACVIQKNGLYITRLIITAHNVGADGDGEFFILTPDDYPPTNVSVPKSFVDSLVNMSNLMATLENEMALLIEYMSADATDSGSIKALRYTTLFDDEDEQDVEVEDEEDLAEDQADVTEYYVPERFLCLNNNGQAFNVEQASDVDAKDGIDNAEEVFIPDRWVSQGEKIVALTSNYANAKETLMHSNEFREAFAIRSVRLAR